MPPRQFTRLSQRIEDRLVQRNIRHMQTLQAGLMPGYLLRAAKSITHCQGNILIATGFPVNNSVETDGPLGAIALYQALHSLDKACTLLCPEPLFSIVEQTFQIRSVALNTNNLSCAADEAREQLTALSPSLIISIEMPGLSPQGEYVNMRGDNISDACACLDPIMRMATCPTIAIGDGGNEIGMGNVIPLVNQLDITPCVTCCDELVLADVSNWGAYGLLAMLGVLNKRDLLVSFDPADALAKLVKGGCLDGITGQSTLTEDSLPVNEGVALIDDLRCICGWQT